MAPPPDGKAVVDLLSDSSDDESLLVAKVFSLGKQKPAARQKQSSEDTIDLCDSSDDEDEAAARSKKKRAKPSYSYSDELSSDDDDDDDDALLAPSEIFARKPHKAVEKPQAQPREKLQAARESLANASYYVAKAKEAAATRRSFLSQEENLNDAELLNYSSGLVIQRRANCKAPPRARTQQTSHAAPPLPAHDSDDDEDALLNYSSGLARSAPRLTTAASSNVIGNPYAKKAPKVSTEAPPVQQQIPTFAYPKLSTNSRQYPDERARFLLAFWSYGRKNCTRRSFERPKLDSTAKRVVRLALTPFPIRSIEEYVSLGAATTSVTNSRQQRDDIREELDQGDKDQIVTPVETASPTRKYYSITEACLVTILRQAESQVEEKEKWIALTDLIPAIDRILRPECPGRLTRAADPDFGANHYLQQSTRSMEFLQVSKLECNLGKEGGPFIKRHSVKGKVHYELLPEGYEAATRIRSRQFPAPPGHYRCSKITTVDQVDTKRYPNICLGVDRREGGGAGRTLHQMCNKLEMMRCPYFVGSLSIGDYVFFTRKNDSTDTSMDLLCPIVVERKSIQDVAMSIYDGRWKSQKHRMYVAQFVFGYQNCHMVLYH